MRTHYFVRSIYSVNNLFGINIYTASHQLFCSLLYGLGSYYVSQSMLSVTYFYPSYSNINVTCRVQF